MPDLDPNVAQWFKDPDFVALPQEKQAAAISNYFSSSVAGDREFQAIAPEQQQAARDNFTRFHMETIPQEGRDFVGHDRGFIGDVGSRLARGGLNLVEGVAGGLRMTDGPDQDEGLLARAGKGLSDFAEQARQEHDIFKPDLGEMQGKEGAVKRGFGGALESVPLSLGPLAGMYGGAKVGALGGAAIGGPPGAAIGGVVGGAIGGLGTMFGTFFLGEYQNTYDEARKQLEMQGLSKEEIDQKAGTHALVSATAEFGGELVSDLAALTFFGVIGRHALKQTVNQTVKQVLGGGGKNFVKAVAKSAPFEVGSEVGTAYFQASSAQGIGISDTPPSEAMAEAVLPSVFMSLMFGGAVHGMNAVSARKITNDLNSEDPAARIQAAEAIGQRIEGQEEKQTWLETAKSLIESGDQIPISKPIADFAVQKKSEETGDPERVLSAMENDLYAGTLSPEDALSTAPGLQQEFGIDPADVAAIVESYRQGLAADQSPEMMPDASQHFEGEFSDKIEAAQAEASQATAPQDNLFPAQTPDEQAAIEREIVQQRSGVTPMEQLVQRQRERAQQDMTAQEQADARREDARTRRFDDLRQSIRPRLKNIVQQPAVQPVDINAAEQLRAKEQAKQKRFDVFRQQLRARLQPESTQPAAAGDTQPVGTPPPRPPGAVGAKVDAKAHEAATSPENTLPEPTEAQAKAGNYKKGHVRLHGMDISIENPHGSTRSGTDTDGRRWETTMHGHYGYFRRSEGKDGDQIDVFVAPDGTTDSGQAYVVDQVDPKTGKFDEHKVMLGFSSEQAARDAYMANYEPGWKGLGDITAMDIDSLKQWISGGRQSRPLGAPAPAPSAKPVAARPAPTQEKKPDVAVQPQADVPSAQTISIDTMDNWRKQGLQSGSAANGWRVFRDPIREQFVLMKKQVQRNDAGGGYKSALMVDGFGTVEAAREYAKQNTGTAPAQTVAKPSEAAASAQQPGPAPQAKEAKPPKKPRPKKGVTTLRGRIKEMGGIDFLNFKGELKAMPPTVRIGLSRKSGVPLDRAERTLRGEGWIGPEESLLEILRDAEVLKRGRAFGSETTPKTKHQAAQEEKFQRESEYEPEAPPEGEYIEMRAGELPEGKKLTILDGNNIDGWDTYEVIESDPFGVTLQDGTIVELSSSDVVQVRVEDLPAKQRKDAVSEQLPLFAPEPSLFDSQDSVPSRKRARKSKPQKHIQHQLFGYNQYEDLFPRQAEPLQFSKKGVPKRFVQAGMETTGQIDAENNLVRNADDAAALLAHLGDQAQENVYFVATDVQGRVLEIHRYSKGSINRSLVRPSEAVGHLLDNNEVGRVFFAHNHPSGKPTASADDVSISQVLADTLALSNIPVESIVIGDGEYTNIETGERNPIRETVRKVRLDVSERRMARPESGRRLTITHPDVAISALKKHDNQEGVLFLDGSNTEAGFMPWPKGDTHQKAAQKIIAEASKTNAAAIIINLKDGKTVEAGSPRYRFLSNMIGAMEGDVATLDLIVDGESMFSSGKMTKPASRSKALAGLKSDEILFQRRNPRTQTKAFKSWFGNSKVVDENGKPRVMYHGTSTPTFDKFSKKYQMGMGGPLGFWFASTGEAATQFARDRIADQGGGVYPVYLSIQNPVEYQGWKEFVEHVEKLRKGKSIEDGVKALRREAVRRGKDGIVIRNSDTDMGGVRDDWVAFNPTQIKSVFNRGTFDPNNPSILYSMRGAQPHGTLKAPQIRAITDAISSDWANAPRIKVVQEQSELPGAILDHLKSIGAESDIVDGTFYRGTVYLVADNLASPKAAVETLMHEAFGHYGIRGVLGDQLKTTLARVYIAKRAEAQAIAKEYGFDLKTAEGRMLAADEWLAREAVNNPQSGWVNQAVSKVREWLRKVFPKLKFTDGEIRNLLAGARRNVTGEFNALDALANERGMVGAWHGSPHKFDKFTTDRIGTGEGAQAFGWGLYFTDKKDIADFYAKKLSGAGQLASLSDHMARIELDGKPLIKKHDIDQIEEAVHYAKDKDNEGMKAFAERSLKRWRELSEDKKYPFHDYAVEKVAAYDGLLQDLNSGLKVSYPQGAVYKTTLFPNRQDEVWLDWDKKLVVPGEDSKIKSFISNHLQGEGYKYKKDPQWGMVFTKKVSGGTDLIPAEIITGDWFYNRLVGQSRNLEGPFSGSDFAVGEKQNGLLIKSDSQAASMWLKSKGIDGIRYPAGSLSGGKAEGTNYVVFDDSAVQVDEILFKRAESADPNHKAAQDFNKEYPGHNVKYDGIQEGFGSIKDRFQFTATDGPAKGATFTTATADIAGIKSKLDEMVEMRKPADAPLFSRTADPAAEKYMDKLRALYTAKGAISPAKTARLIDKYEKLTKGLKDAREDIYKKQKALEDHIKENLPPAERYRVMAHIKRMAGVQGKEARQRRFEAALERVEQAHQRVTKITNLKRLEALLDKKKPKRTPRGVASNRAMDDHANRMVDLIHKAVGQDYDSAMADVAQIFDDADRKNQEPTAEQFEEIFVAQMFGGIKDRSAQEIHAATETLKEIIDKGRASWWAEESRRKERMGELRDTATEEFTGGKGLKSAEQVDQEKMGASLWKGISDKLRDYDTLHQSFEFLLDKLTRYDKTSKPLEGKTTEYFASMVHAATHAEHQGNLAQQKLIHDKVKEVFGAKKLTRRLQENTQLHNKTGVYRYFEGRKIEKPLSQNKAYKLWQMFQQPSIREEMEHHGYTAETLRQLEKFIKPDVMKWAKWQIEEFYPQYREGINEIYKALFYIDMPNIEGYTPISRQYEGQTIDDALLGEGGHYRSILPGSVKSRTKNMRDFNILDGDSVLMKHIVEMEHFKAWGIPMREMRSVLGSEAVQTAIKQYHGPVANTALKQFMDHFASGGIDRASTLSALDRLRANFTRSVLGANPVVFIKQLASIPAYAMDMPVADFTKGVASFFANPMRAHKTLMQSKMMQNRYEVGFERDIMLALQRSTIKHMTGAKTVSDFLMLMTRLGDKTAILVGGWANYQYHLKRLKAQGVSHEKAHKRALVAFERSTERSQQAGNIKDLAHFQRLGSIGKLFTMFMTAPTSYYRNVASGIRNLAAGRGSKTENLKRAAVGYLVLPMFFQWIASGFDWEDEKMLRAAAVGPLNGLFIARDAIEGIMTALFEGHAYFSLGTTPPLTTIQKAARAGVSVNKALQDGFDGEYFLKAAGQITEVAGLLTGIPVGTVKRTLKGIKDVAEYETERPIRRIIGFPEPKERD